MKDQKGSLPRDDLKTLRDQVVHEFHLISEGIIDQVKQVAEGVVNLNEKLDRTRQELKTEIRETRQEILSAVKFSYAELDKRLTMLEQEFTELKLRVQKIENRSAS